MSANYVIYIGPYFICDRKQFEEEKADYGCVKCSKSIMENYEIGNIDKINTKKAFYNFCTTCGQKLIEYKTRVKINGSSKIYEAICEESERSGLSDDDMILVSKKNHWLYIPNKKVAYRIEKQRYFGNAKDYEHISWLDENELPEIDENKLEFANNYIKYREIFEKVLGKEAVSIKWGVVPYII